MIGVILAFAYEKSGSLQTTLLAHVLNNGLALAFALLRSKP